LGAEQMSLWVGSFWGILETRPYMRTRFGLAETLWDAGEQTEAIAHYVELLRLDPYDHLGVRYVLVHAYLQLEQHDALRGLFALYPDDVMPHWLYSRALFGWRMGEWEDANEALNLGFSVNGHIPKYLLSQSELPTEPARVPGIRRAVAPDPWLPNVAQVPRRPLVQLGLNTPTVTVILSESTVRGAAL